MAAYDYYSYYLTVTGSLEDQQKVYDLLVAQGDIIGPEEFLMPNGTEEAPYSFYSCPENLGSVIEWYELDQEEVLHEIALQVPTAILELEGQNEDDTANAFKKRFHGDLFQESRMITHIPEFAENGDRPFLKRYEPIATQSEAKKQNAGYTILDLVTLEGNTFVLGHNPKSPSPYVTWKKLNDDTYIIGNYFANLDNARVDLLHRAIGSIPDRQIHQLTQSLLTEEDRLAIWLELRKENLMEDVRFCLEYAADELNLSPATVDRLMEDPTFRSQSLYLAENIDHSAENEALQDNLISLITQNFKNYLPRDKREGKGLSLDLQIKKAQRTEINKSMTKPEPDYNR